MSIRPPFRADQVGSLLRSAPLKQAREKRAKGEISAAELTAVEDAEIIKLIAKQEAIGLEGITDGEYRRSWWHYDFLWGLDGVEKVAVDQGIQFAGVQTKAEAPHVMKKIGFTGHAFVDHFKFLRAHTKKTAKQTIPSPSMLHYRGGRKLINMGVYPDMNDFYHDLGAAYGKAIAAFGEAGCTYLQLDDVSFAYLCDPEQRKMLKDRGDDPEKQPGIYAGMINKALESKP
ncbi:MAG TPA: 5-methyltetrahydropteroyltriglutamate--homocysteine S-methyltransferase, partial [Rhodoblastus sp.]|nr:5-methyltetrahydropteroyltriglutamate--homocysteine S-methyltransferase [Rhodoblastus sp.]